MNNALYVDVHALQTVPPSCINRDDTGSPKTARFGGVTRARVSSQAWKKAIRNEFAGLLDESELGVRTKDVVGLIAESIASKSSDIEPDEALSMATSALTATGIKVTKGLTGYLLFVSRLQAESLARLATEARERGSKIEAKEAKAILNPRERPTLNAIDVALFGRMVADNSALNVDASVQVAHALGVCAAEPEFDYFTAMDDRSPEETSGAGMIGTVEFLSTVFYRYATVDVRHLCENLGSPTATVRAMEAFLEAFARSMPTGKQNTFANRTLPQAVVVQLRTTQPVSLVGAFERPVIQTARQSISEIACERMVEQAKAIDEAFGTTPSATFVTCSSPDLKPSLEKLSAQFGSLGTTIEGTSHKVASFLTSLENA